MRPATGLPSPDDGATAVPAGLPPTFRVVRTDASRHMPRTDAALRAWGGELTLVPEHADEATLAQAVQGAELLLTCHARITRRVLEAAPRLKAVVKCGVGIDAIDIDAACALGAGCPPSRPGSAASCGAAPSASSGSAASGAAWRAARPPSA